MKINLKDSNEHLELRRDGELITNLDEIYDNITIDCGTYYTEPEPEGE